MRVLLAIEKTTAGVNGVSAVGTLKTDISFRKHPSMMTFLSFFNETMKNFR